MQAFKNYGSRLENFNKLLGEIYTWMDKNETYLKPIWVGSKFQIADRPSRESFRGEEFLPRILFFDLQKILRVNFTLDAMATKANTKCDLFCSWLPAEKPYLYNFFSLRQNQLKYHTVYIFPGRKLLGRVAKHIEMFLKNIKIVLIFQKWAEWPIELSNLKNLSNVNLRRLPSYFCTLIPSEQKIEIKKSLCYGTPVKTYNSMYALLLNINNKRKWE